MLPYQSDLESIHSQWNKFMQLIFATQYKKFKTKISLVNASKHDNCFIVFGTSLG